jgi:integrase
VIGTHNSGAESKFEPVFLKVWEVDALVEQLRTEQDRMYVRLLVGTGMRKGEALALRVGDIDLAGPIPAVVIDKARKHNHAGSRVRTVDGVTLGGHRVGAPKTRSSRRTVRIDKVLAEQLRDFTAGRGGAEVLFDLGNEGTWQNNHWAPARTRAQLAVNPRIHDLRHTHASILLASGVPLFQVSKRLGHKDIQTTSNIYGHLDKSADVASADAFEAAMYPTGAPRKLRVV